ncbi:MAG: hypothetical protein V3T73_00990, partial [Dehalococcoidales bacterium]
GFDNGALSGQPYGLRLLAFGWRLTGPFGFCASTGSHLTRLSELRWGPTNLVPSLYFFSF